MRRWFLPAQPDLMALLAEQGRVTLEGIDAFVEWAGGAEGKGDEVRVAEHGADDARRAVQRALRIAFTTPLSAEDLYEPRALVPAKDEEEDEERPDVDPESRDSLEDS